MAKRKSRKKRRSRSLSGIGGTSFNASRINQNSVVNDLAKPVAIGFAGAAAGYFAGKRKNLLLAGIGGLAAIASGHAQQLLPAVIGCAVVTPPADTTTTSGIDGLEGLKDFVSGGANRSKGYAKSVLSNLGLQSVADKIAVNGFAGLNGGDDAQAIYDEGYMAGVGDLAALDEGDQEINGGYLLAQGGSKPRSMTAAIAENMGIK